MKLNNRGFAITGILYGLLILFALLVGSYLTILTAKKNRLDGIVTDIENEYNNKENLDNNVTYTVELEKIMGTNITQLTTQTIKSNNKFEYLIQEISSTSYTYSSVKCTNSQKAISSVSKNGRITERTITIENVTNDTKCTVTYVKSSSGVVTE